MSAAVVVLVRAGTFAKSVGFAPDQGVVTGFDGAFTTSRPLAVAEIFHHRSVLQRADVEYHDAQLPVCTGFRGAGSRLVGQRDWVNGCIAALEQLPSTAASRHLFSQVLRLRSSAADLFIRRNSLDAGRGISRTWSGPRYCVFGNP